MEIQGQLTNWIQIWLEDRGRKQLWKNCGVLLGLVPGPVFFVVCIQHVNINQVSNKFADAMKVGGGVLSKEVCPRLQYDIDQTESWIVHWQMEFIHDKCEMMHFCKPNRGRTY